MKKLKIGDSVIVTSGGQKGTAGEVVQINFEKGRIQVSNMNPVIRHMKPRKEMGFDGGRTEIPRWIDISNVSLVDPKDGKPTRVKFVSQKDGKLERVGVRSGAKIVPQVKPKEEVKEEPTPTAKKPKTIKA